MRDSKQIFIKQLMELWQEYTEVAVNNANYTDNDFTFDKLMTYLIKRYGEKG